VKHVSELKFVVEDKEAWTLARASLGELYIAKGDTESTSQLLDDCEKTIKDIDFVDSLVNASYYRTKTLFHKSKNEPQEFFRSGLSYLAYAKVEQVDKEERAGLSFDLGIAALIGEDIYNFGELVDNQIFDSLRGTPQEWLAHVIIAFNNGQIDAWRQLETRFATQLNAQPGLLANKRTMEQKIAILALMQLVFSRGSLDRTLTFAEVSQVTQVARDQVELLLMRALSLELLKGRIDQVGETISITWVQPRVLSKEQVATLRDKLADWSVKVDNALRLMENHMPELKA
jgi:26S proteasome regulatory subunit N9